jgi:hypothetical protein
MAKEEKERKRFKAVTEEVTAPVEERATPIEEIKEEEMEASKEKEAEIEEETPAEHGTHTLHVLPTDNISKDEAKHERGAFFKIFLITFFATLLAFLFAGGIYVYLNGVKSTKNIEATPTPQADISSSPTPEASPLANVDLTTFKIDVLNGNGGIGVATAAKNIIEKAGFKVDTVGNADNFNFTDTVIQVKPSVSADITSKLKDALSSNYSVKIGDALSASDSFDIVVTVGSK